MMNSDLRDGFDVKRWTTFKNDGDQAMGNYQSGFSPAADLNEEEKR